MKFLEDISNKQCKVSLYWWNSKFIVKFETPFLEQTYKFPEFDVSGEDEVKEFIDQPEFLAKVYKRFEEMALIKGLTTMNTSSKSFAFLSEEEDLYSVEDLKEKF